MPTYAALSAELLKDAAKYFRRMASENEPVSAEMLRNAGVYDRLAELLTQNPGGRAGDETYAQLAAKLLQDTAKFYRQIGNENSPLKEHMDHSAEIYEEMADFVAKDPLGVMD